MINGTVIYGGSFNPPGVHHRRIVEVLSAEFSRVIVIPCGMRREKLTIGGVDPWHRATMADLTFGDLPNVTIATFDLEQAEFTPTIKLAEMYQDQAPLWFAVGTDLIQGGAAGQAEIMSWVEGQRVWQELNFAVIERAGYPLNEVDLPPHRIMVTPQHTGSSSIIRQRLFQFLPVTNLVMPAVERYIDRYGLYHGAPPLTAPTYQVEPPRLLIVADQTKPAAVELAERLEKQGLVDPVTPNLILVLGGDGTMINAVREHWRRRIPFLGINHGTVGFLLNDYPAGFSDQQLADQWIIRQTSALYVQFNLLNGQIIDELAFFDAYAKAQLDPLTQRDQAACIEISVDGQVVIPKMICDAALVSTACGSTGYAFSMGANPIPVGTPNLILAGSAVWSPGNWRPAQLHPDAAITFRNIDSSRNQSKRPLFGIVDGHSFGQIKSMTIRRSRVASAELAFLPDYDLHRKLLQVQFPNS